MKLSFKVAKPQDAEMLVDIYNQAFFDDYKKYGECPGYGKTVEQMEQSIIMFPKFVIIADDYAVGVVSVKDHDNGNYEIGCLCVVPEYQRKGIGTKAVEFVTSLYFDWKTFSLITPADKKSNINFYTKKCGFEIVGTEKDGNVTVSKLQKSR